MNVVRMTLTDRCKFLALFIFGILPLVLLTACGRSDADTNPPAPDGYVSVPLHLSELGDDCWFEVDQYADVTPMCPPDYGWDTPQPKPTTIPVVS